MKVKFINREEKLKIISASLLAGTFLISGCSNNLNKNNNGDKTVSTGESVINSSAVTENIESLPETSETIAEPKTYDIMWGDTASQDFSNYLEKKLGINLKAYVHIFGFTDELNIIYSEYMEKNYSTEGRVSFKTSNYFFTFVDTCESSGRRMYRDYEFFSGRYFNKDNCLNGTFVNKFIMSYLCQNNIRLGYMIPVDNFKLVNQDYINICLKYDVNTYLKNQQLGNFNNGYAYSSEETIALMKLYNNSLCYMYYSESAKDQDLLSKPEAVEAFNQNLKTYYGPNAPQIGQVVTVEQYRAMFGEDPLDLSYIPGAVVQETPVKGAAKVRVDYNSSYDNYDVYYTEPYYGDESSGRGRRM